jgi:hypothetical protein
MSSHRPKTCKTGVNPWGSTLKYGRLASSEPDHPGLIQGRSSLVTSIPGRVLLTSVASEPGHFSNKGSVRKKTQPITNLKYLENYYWDIIFDESQAKLMILTSKFKIIKI